jgi:hypothetical protein
MTQKLNIGVGYAQGPLYFRHSATIDIPGVPSSPLATRHLLCTGIKRILSNIPIWQFLILNSPFRLLLLVLNICRIRINRGLITVREIKGIVQKQSSGIRCNCAVCWSFGQNHHRSYLSFEDARHSQCDHSSKRPTRTGSLLEGLVSLVPLDLSESFRRS